MQFKINCFSLICLGMFWGVTPLAAQQPIMVQTEREYRQVLETDSTQKLVQLDKVISTIKVELRYAQTNNFMGGRLYSKKAKAFLRQKAASALQKVVAALADSGYRLKIWDAYRPYSITKKMWDLIGDERYVANPAKGSNHNRGLAVDVTLTQNGKDADMGTGFDNFTDTAHHGFTALPTEILYRRKLLRSVMERNGFVPLETEWWHYAYKAVGIAVLDVPMKKLY